MRVPIRTLILAAAGCCAAAKADAPASDLSRAADGAFKAMLFATEDSRGFQRAWEAPSHPPVPTVGSVRRGKPVYAMVVFAGCTAGNEGKCDVEAEFTLLDPKGRPFHKPQTAVLWSEPPPADNVHLSPAAVEINVDSGASLGTYTLRALVTDKVAQKTLTVERPLAAMGGGSD